MSLSNRFQHPFEKWMNQMWKRENGPHRRPTSYKPAKHSSKSLSRPTWSDWANDSLMAPLVSPRWMESYRDRWDDSFGSELMNFDPSKMMMQTEMTTNDHGDHVVKARMPFDIEQDDIHLNFEDGGLRLSASKVHEEEKKHGLKHKSFMEVSHYWPLAEDIKSEDIEAHFDSDEGLLEIIIPQSKLMASRYGRGKSTPITIGGKSPNEMLDRTKSAAEYVQEKGSEYVGKAKEAVASGIETLKETVKGAKPDTEAMSEKGSEMAGKAKETWESGKEKGAEAAGSMKEKSSEMAGKAKETSEKGADSLKEGAKNVKADVKATAQSVKDKADQKGKTVVEPQAPSLDEM